MIISFDIDNTLIPYSNEFETYELGFFAKLLGAESLRMGTKELFKELESQNHEIWIYTTSFRSVFKLSKTFRLHGLKPSKYINETINQKHLKRANCKSSKNPKLFGIDIHIDDSAGVGMEGERFGFKTIIINPSDRDWKERVLEGIQAFVTQY